MNAESIRYVAHLVPEAAPHIVEHFADAARIEAQIADHESRIRELRACLRHSVSEANKAAQRGWNPVQIATAKGAARKRAAK